MEGRHSKSNVRRASKPGVAARQASRVYVSADLEVRRTQAAQKKAARSPTLRGRYHLAEIIFSGYRVIRFQGYRVTRLQGFKVTGLQGFRVTRLQGFKVSGFQGYKVVSTL